MLRMIIVTLALIIVCANILILYCCLIVASRENDILERMFEKERIAGNKEKQQKEES